MEISVDQMSEMLDSTKEQPKKTVGAKILSKLAMIFSSLWIASLTILKGMGKIGLSENEIIISGVAITAVWTPTFASIVIDKISQKI